MLFISFSIFSSSYQLLKSQISRHSTTWWVICFFSSLFSSIERIIPNTIQCVLLRVSFFFSSFLFFCWLSDFIIIICWSAQCAKHLFAFSFLWPVIQIRLHYSLSNVRRDTSFSIVHILPFSSHCLRLNTHLIRARIFRVPFCNSHRFLIFLIATHETSLVFLALTFFFARSIAISSSRRYPLPTTSRMHWRDSQTSFFSYLMWELSLSL